MGRSRDADIYGSMPRVDLSVPKRQTTHCTHLLVKTPDIWGGACYGYAEHEAQSLYLLKVLFGAVATNIALSRRVFSLTISTQDIIGRCIKLGREGSHRIVPAQLLIFFR